MLIKISYQVLLSHVLIHSYVAIMVNIYLRRFIRSIYCYATVHCSLIIGKIDIFIKISQYPISDDNARKRKKNFGKI